MNKDSIYKIYDIFKYLNIYKVFFGSDYYSIQYIDFKDDKKILTKNGMLKITDMPLQRFCNNCLNMEFEYYKTITFSLHKLKLSFDEKDVTLLKSFGRVLVNEEFVGISIKYSSIMEMINRFYNIGESERKILNKQIRENTR